MGIAVETQTEREIAPCLQEGPIADVSQRLVQAAKSLGQTRAASVIRAWLIAYLYRQIEAIFASGEEPVTPFNRLLEDTARLLETMTEHQFIDLGAAIPTGNGVGGAASTENVTGEHYGRLFEGFSADSFWEETLRLLRIRLERNAVDLASLQSKSLLDAGCGGGRYTAAWYALGARPACGVDISPINIADATRRVEAAGMTGVRYQPGDVLDLPFPDESFDIVFSNGVLHHTRDWQQGTRELVRVMKQGGMGWLYLIENPGGLYWDSVEILRVIMSGEDRETARATLRLLGLPGNRIFYMLDHVMVPINVRLTPEEIEDCLQSAGASSIRRLNRGADFDRIERIYQGDPYARIKYGVGENRYLFSKA